MEQEHRITYKAGITRTPSDFLCQDGELAECINLATDNEELKPVVQPVEKLQMPVNSKLLYVHRFNDEVRYIFLNNYYGSYRLCVTNGEVYREMRDSHLFLVEFDDDNVKVTSLGKTLLVSHVGDEVNYFVWSVIDWSHEYEQPYRHIGNIIPDPKIEFYLQSDTEEVTHLNWDRTDLVEYGYTLGHKASTVGIIADRHQTIPMINHDSQDTYNDLVLGLYKENIRSVNEKKGFCKPFFIRYALRMYDGTYTHISNPVLLFPSVTRNSFAFYNPVDEMVRLYTKYCKLFYKYQSNNLSDFEDVISDVDIFISYGVDVYDTVSDQTLYTFEDADENTKVIADGIYHVENDASSKYRQTLASLYVSYHDEVIPIDVGAPHATRGYALRERVVDAFRVDILKEKKHEDIFSELKSTRLYYKLCSLGLKDSEGDMGDRFETHVLETLTTRDYLENDDYFSRCLITSSYMYVYNSRLNMANVERGFFEGYDNFLPFDNDDEATYNFFVKVVTDTGTTWLRHTKTGITQKQGIYFFYPDARAKHVTIYKKTSSTSGVYGTCICDENLEEHPGLNGAFFFKGLPGVDVDESTGVTVGIDGFHENDTYNNRFRENLLDYVVTSKVNNPWVFLADGYNKVGIGEILGVSTNTMALSQDQFGRTDLIVFSESGIWGMQLDRTGLFESIHSVTRDICINPHNITQIDGAVFFVSKRGLMVISANGVRCVSELMNGMAFNTAVLSPLATGTDWAGIVSACQGETTFLEYIRDEATFMSYDYIDSRIVITKPGAGFSFAYNIADGTISKVILPAAMTGAVNNYPDYLLQGTVTVEGTTQNRLYSYYEKPREENVAERQLGFVLTRPMKLAGPVSQASLRQLMNVGTWMKKDAQGNELSCVKTEVYLSEDMQTWFPDISRYGAAARYYRLALFIKMLPTERLSGTILTEQERRSHNMR